MEAGVSPPEPKVEIKRGTGTCVRLSEEEHARISQDAKASGRSIPHLLKFAYFAGRQVRLLVDKEEQAKWFRELRACGNNLNQIARRINGGVEAGWHQELEVIARTLVSLETLVLGAHGRR